jgi:hypothetical protein
MRLTSGVVDIEATVDLGRAWWSLGRQRLDVISAMEFDAVSPSRTLPQSD